MRMCCNTVRDIPFAFNAIFSFLFAFYSTVAFADERLSSDSIVLPLKTDDVGDALLLGFEFGNTAGSGEPKRNVISRISSNTNDGSKTIRKRDQSASNTAWFGPRLGRRKKRSLLTTRQDDDINNNVFVEDTSNSDGSSTNTDGDDMDGEDNVLIVVEDDKEEAEENAEDDNNGEDYNNNSNKNKAILKMLPSRSRLNNNDERLDEEHRVQIIRPYPFTFPVVLDGYVSKRQGGMKPRLGRRSDGLTGTNAAIVENAWDEDEKMLKAPPFSPRLGRRSSSMPLKPRLGRAESAIFKPRLGRGPLPASVFYRNNGYNQYHDDNHNSNNDDQGGNFGNNNHAQVQTRGHVRAPQFRLSSRNH